MPLEETFFCQGLRDMLGPDFDAKDMEDIFKGIVDNEDKNKVICFDLFADPKNPDYFRYLWSGSYPRLKFFNETSFLGAELLYESLCP